MNISDKLEKIIFQFPDKKAVIFPKCKNGIYSYSHITFSELDGFIHQYAAALKEEGFRRGDKTLLFVRPSLQFHAIVFALFKIGVVPVLIDPGMGRKNLLQAIEDVQPEGLVAEREVHLMKFFFNSSFSSIAKSASTNFFFGLGGLNLNTIKIKNFVLDLLFPIKCLGCAKEFENLEPKDKWVCEKCFE